MFVRQFSGSQCLCEQHVGAAAASADLQDSSSEKFIISAGDLLVDFLTIKNVIPNIKFTVA